ncbi:MAG: lambda exonuclease family protein [Pseudomonadota bacterium]
MLRVEVQQGSPDWHNARRGLITATRAADLMKRNKNGSKPASYAQTVAKIAMERIEAAPRALITSRTMERGHDLEDDAAIAYQMETGRDVEVVGLCLHDRYPQFACSPDRLVGTDGGLEIKCPDAPDKMVSYLLEGAHLPEYEGQVRHCLYVTGRKWWDIAAYDPRPPAGWNLVIERMGSPDDWSEYEAELLSVDAEIDATVERLRAVRRVA